ncbi:zinc finger BED domain-containing protein RICESLEEPER 2-like [Coffea arabica]|uniref:Zinc finger BED domain-containing protein RICESLEEPER 2-like n=1 Tax=Coffea arabica TaxID=13443 RepID=A0ABM4W6Y6_COFAR
MAIGEQSKQKQQVLSFTEGPSDGITSITNFSYDHAKWKGERLRFPILSRIAADILSVPITTVASESTFNAGSRVINDRRASMSVETVQMLLCGNDWIRNLHGLKNKSRESLGAAESITFEEVELPE